jgi:hypothetical protein
MTGACPSGDEHVFEVRASIGSSTMVPARELDALLRHHAWRANVTMAAPGPSRCRPRDVPGSSLSG